MRYLVAGLLSVLFLVLMESCVTSEPEPEGMSDWRRCAQECPEIFTLNFATDPPGCECREVPR